MHDGTCLVAVVAGVSFLALMELSRVGAFKGVGDAIHSQFAAAQAPTAKPVAVKGDSTKGESGVRPRSTAQSTVQNDRPRYIQVSSQVSSQVTSQVTSKAPSDNETRNQSSSQMTSHETNERTSPHQARSRDRG
jgi:hypothetical protein